MHRIKTLLAKPRWQRTTLWLTSLLLGASLAAFTGCSGGGGGTGPGGSIAGNYVLEGVDDEAPPVTIHHGPWLDRINVRFYNLYHAEITGGSIELDGDDRFVMSISGTVNADGQLFSMTMYTEGYYEVDGDEIWFTSDDPALGSSVGTLDGGAIYFVVDVMKKGVANELVFER